MVFLNPERMFTVTEAKPRFNALAAEAHQGRMAHIVRGSDVIAHLVPPTARILDEGPLLAALVGALIDQQVEYLATDVWYGGEFHGHAGDVTGRLFAWLWRTDRHLFMKYLAQFHNSVCTKLERQFRMTDVLDLLDTAMGVSLTDSEVDAARRHALVCSDDYFHPAQEA
jgi:hypothetical protein